ncbi:hypothetical protein BBP40_000197 [Aspergillus hancockii]|nr:hypothetical protein BBP40_000197 [Aspergillus hancockii]
MATSKAWIPNLLSEGASASSEPVFQDPSRRMEPKSWYPDDFNQALLNTFTAEEVTSLLKEPNCAPRFVYGALMLPTVLKYYIDVDQSVNLTRSMTRANVSGYRLYEYGEPRIPVIVQSSNPEDTVEGMLVFGLDVQHRNAIYELEGGLMELVDAKVQIRLSDSSLGSYEIRSGRAVDAGMFAWLRPKEGLKPVRNTTWSLDGFLRDQLYENIVQSQRRLSLDGSGQVMRV